MHRNFRQIYYVYHSFLSICYTVVSLLQMHFPFYFKIYGPPFGCTPPPLPLPTTVHWSYGTFPLPTKSIWCDDVPMLDVFSRIIFFHHVDCFGCELIATCIYMEALWKTVVKKLWNLWMLCSIKRNHLNL